MTEVLNVTPIENRTLQERAYRELKKALLTGQLRPGQTLNLRGLAAALGTSVMPVRDAVGRLAAEQALELMPNRSIRVPVLDRAQFDELWQLRIEMEGKAAALAAERATPEEIADIAELCAAVRAEAEAGDVAAMLAANSALHFAIYRSARTYILLRIIETLRMQSGPQLTEPLNHCLKVRHPFLAQTLGYHEDLVAALRAGDAARATEIRRDDLQSLADFIRARWSDG